MTDQAMIDAQRLLILPAGATKFCDKQSDAVAYIYSTRITTRSGPAEAPCAAVFFGSQSKPVERCRYSSTASRERDVLRLFEARRAHLARKVANKAEARASVRSAEVGAIYYTSWGYDQTQIDYYQITKLVGATMVEVRKMASTTVAEHGAAWSRSLVPNVDAPYIGQPHRCKMNAHGFTVDGHGASKWDGKPKTATSGH